MKEKFEESKESLIKFGNEIEGNKKIEMNEKDLNILEIGCSYRPFFVTLENANLGGAHYIGVENYKWDLKHNYWDKVVEIKAKDYPKKIDKINANASALPLENRCIDEVVLRDIIGDLDIERDKLPRFIKEAYRILKEKGRLILIEISTPEVAKKALEQGLISTEDFKQVANKYKFNKTDKANKDAFILTFEKEISKHEKEN